MKRFLFYAAALIAVAACTREPVIPEDPEEPVVEQSGPIRVTLVAAEPETRTELGTDYGTLQPYWSVGDNITLVRVPDDEDDDDDFERVDDDYVYHLFSSELSQKSLTARFTGDVDYGGQYRAFYPEQTSFYRWGDEILSPRLDGYSIAFNIPTVQHPSITSFDPSADLLVSAPFEIQAGDSQAVGAEAPDIPISFTRVNAIVKVEFNPTGDLRNKLAGQTVRRVVLGYYSSPEGEEDGYMAPRTRVNFLSDSEDDEGHGLTGQVYYIIPFIHDLEEIEEFDANYYDECWVDEDESYSGVVAEYLDESYTIVDPDNPQAATYFIVAPSIMKNTEYDGEIEGLPIEIYTEDYVIRRNIILPDNGIALQPSVVTTLIITLSNSNAEVVKKGITLSKSETTLISEDGEYVDLQANEITFPRNTIESAEDFETYFTVNAPEGISLRWVEYGEVGDYGTAIGWEGDEVSNLYLSVASSVQPGDYTVTITYEGCSATCTVHVLDKNSLTDKDFIAFADPNVEEICVRAWGGHIRTGELSKYEASKVTSLINTDNYKSYFRENTDIQSFEEFEFFTGLTAIDYNAFDGCTSLEKIKLPKNITKIEDHDGGTGYAFRNCTSLTTVDLSECTSLYRIGESSFENCSSLVKITLPASVNFIGSDAFRNCTSLTTVVIPTDSQLETIYGEYNYWTSPNHHGAFYGCSSLKSIWLPPTVKTIDYAAFMNSALSSISIPDGIKKIGSYAFSGCEFLKSISIPSGIESILDYTFRNCYSLSTVILPEGLSSIGKLAFFYCTDLHELEFPASLTTIGNWSGENLVFYGVEFRSGTDNDGHEYHGVKFRGVTPPSFEKADIEIKGKHWDASANDGEGGWVDGVVIYVPRGSKDAYLAVSNINSNITDTDLRNSLFVEYD